MATQTAYVSTMVGPGLWEAASCGDIELIMMMPEEYKKKTDVASCVEDSTPFSLLDLLPTSLRQYARIIVYMTLYMICGPALIMCNKHLVKDINFKYPMTLSLWSQVMGSLIVCFHVHVMGASMPNKDRITKNVLLRQILPIGALMALKMIMGMKAFLYLTVSFIQIFKAFAPALTLFILFVSGVETPTRKVTFSVLTMCFGICITAFGELNFSPIGLTLIFGAQLCEATRLMLMQKFVKKLNFKAIELQYFRAPACAICLLVFASVIEFPTIYEKGAYMRIYENFHMFLLQSFLGFAVNIVNTLVIKVTNSVTLKVLAVVRNAFLVLINMAFFGEVVTGRQFVGYGVLLCAFTMFQKFRREQSAAQRERAHEK